MVSMPFVPANMSPEVALADSDADTTWNRAMWYDSMDASDPWKQYSSIWASSLNDLTAVDNTRGVWIYVTAVGDGFVNVTGVQPVTTAVQLRTGWNLVGFPSDDAAYTVAMLKSDCPSVSIVERFDGAQTYRTSAMADAEPFVQGAGYWVYCSADVMWNKAW
jgi:hypothetical protein